MANDFIGIDIAGLPELLAKLQALPDEMQDQVTEAVATYLINVLRLYPSQRSVTRAQAYPDTPPITNDGRSVPGFFSMKQLRWFFAALNRGELDVPYKRTQGIARGWQAIGSGRNMIIANEAPGVMFVHDNQLQSRHEALVGWQKINSIISQRSPRLGEVMDGAIKKAIRKTGL